MADHAHPMKDAEQDKIETGLMPHLKEKNGDSNPQVELEGRGAKAEEGQEDIVSKEAMQGDVPVSPEHAQ